MIQLLTKKQLHVLEMIAHGFTSDDIAILKQISIRSVEGMRRKIVTKLRVRTMSEAIAYGITVGLFPYDPPKFSEFKRFR